MITDPKVVNPWIRRYRPAPNADHRLVCFPHAGGAANYFRAVATMLAPAADVLSVQYPGRQDRLAEPCVEGLGELAGQVSGQLLGWTDRPIALFGHSMGATVAFEVARRLERAGVLVSGLFVSARSAPSRNQNGHKHLLDDRALLAEVRKLSGTDDSLLKNDDIMEMMLPVLRSDYRATELYRCTPGAAVSCPIRVLLGEQDAHVELADAEAWREHTSGSFELRMFPGGHFYLQDRWADVTGLLAEHVGGKPRL